MDSSIVSQVQRKIELQSPEDLAYLVANVRHAAAARVNEAFPQADRHDELRNQIEAQVNQYIEQTFALALPNLSINGLPVSPAHLAGAAGGGAEAEAVAYEPFDGRKRQRVADLVAREEKLLEEVAALKRSVPAAAAAQQARLVGEGVARDEEQAERRKALLARRAAGAGAAALSVAALDRQAAVEGAFAAAVDALQRLKRDMPAVVARMERARVAAEYVVGDGK
ncbi:uncharacterized protein UV8b_05135 [Ustilaginoidea virens]|uniref:Kinetochore protein mis14 n=1 Tax=Ustilaginoidea virens TaxID=1159556 RepID=A0A1B5KWM7_USTVR|nr:uncharacterized protein UV8b_05135 [Ustilaginoidea virens]QUC20894.1 hypothetical protein UV8b_05135 [Ustilaginoidea virens]GAO14961.1 hypothetical protein UVI_02007920 [Ustilaginoidea virens]